MSPYYICQLAGWGIAFLCGAQSSFGYMKVLEIWVLVGLVSSHLLRMVIIRAGWLEKPLARIWPWVMGAMVLTCVVAAAVKAVLLDWLADWPRATFFPSIFDYLLLLMPWTGIYFCYHHIQESRLQGARDRELRQRIAVMQQQCEESGTDMEGIMETLQRISSLIEEDPGRSREEITEFSKLLRTGYMR